MNDNYDTDNFDATHGQIQVLTVHTCAHINEQNEGDEDGNPATNHWSVFLQLAGGGSVGLDMIPGYGSDGLRGKIEVASKDCSDTQTQSTIKTLSFPVKVYATVQTITEVINSKGRDRYRFTEEWQGCRFWVYTFISDLEDAGIVQAGSGQSAQVAVSYYWRNPSGSELRPAKQGTFY